MNNHDIEINTFEIENFENMKQYNIFWILKYKNNSYQMAMLIVFLFDNLENDSLNKYRDLGLFDSYID